MTQQEKEKMFLDLNSVLVKFWIEQGRPEKEIKIELLERMLNWYKKMGYVIPDGQSKEPVSEDLEEEIKRYIPRDQCPVPDFMEAVARHFAEWQKEQILRIVKNWYELSMTFVTGNSEVDQAIQMDRLTLVKIIEEGKR